MDRLPGMEEYPFLNPKQGVGRNEVMIMEIQRVTNAYQAMVYGQTGPKTKKIEPDKAPEKTKESVELSPSSLNLQKVKEEVKKAPEIRIPIVEEIMKRIKNNDYPISQHMDEAIDKMLRAGVL
jgi:hypothetical protein